MSHDDVIALLGAYALDAVDPEEAAEVARHLASCPRCAAEVDQHRGTAALLANLGGDAPEALWDRISAELRQPDAEAPPPLAIVPGDRRPGQSPTAGAVGGADTSATGGTGAGATGGTGAGATGGATAGATGGATAGQSAAARARRRWTWAVVPTLAAAAAVIIAVLAVQVGRLDGRVGRLSALASHQSMPALAEAALADPQAERVVLSAAGSSHRVVGDLVVLPDGQAYLVAGNLPALPAGHTYQLWGVSGSQAISLGLLGRHPTVAAFALGTAAPVTAFVVTAEPAGGVVVATGPPVAEGVAHSD